MRNTIYAVPVIALLIASNSQAAQILVNRGFQSAPDGTGWTITAPVHFIADYAGPGNLWVPGPVPDGNGGRGVQVEQNGGVVGSFAQGNVQQYVTMTPGLYEVSASVWVRVYDSAPNFSRARFELRANGTNAAAALEQIDEVNSGNNPDPINEPDLLNGAHKWNPWRQLQTATYVVNVGGLTPVLGVFLQMRADGTGNAAGWGQVVADSFRLDATLLTPPTVTDAEYFNINASIPGSLAHQFVATDTETPAGPFTWDQLQLISYTPNYGGVGPGPAIIPTLSGSGQFNWNTVGSPRGDYVWQVRGSDPHNLNDTGTITVHVTQVPEPATVALCGLAMVGAMGLFRRR